MTAERIQARSVKAARAATESLTLACALGFSAAGGATGQSPQATAPETLHLQLVAEIGGDVVDEAYLLHRVGDIAIAATGEIHILDIGDRQIKVYDPSGAFIRRFGREGAGPGEFLSPGRITADSLVQVFDGQQQRVSVFGLDGSHRSTRRLPAMSDPLPTAVYPLRGGALLGLAPARYSSNAAETELNHLVTYRVPGEADSQILFSYRSGAVSWHPVGEAVPYGLFPGGFGNGGAVALHGDSLIALADGYSGKVNWLSADASGLTNIREAHIPVASVPVTDAHLRAAERRFREDRDSQLPRRLALESPPYWSVASRALFADDGSLWIQATVDGAAGEVWSVFLAEGEPRVIRMPENFELRSIHRNRMYGMSLTANDAQMVRIFEWQWR